MAPEHNPPPAYLRRGPFSTSNPGIRRLEKSDDGKIRIRWRRVISAVVALVTLSAFGAAIWLAYEQGVRRGLQLSPPLIRAETGPIKIPPVAVGGLYVPNQDKEVFEVLVAAEPEERVERLLQPPDEPLPAPEPEKQLAAESSDAKAAVISDEVMPADLPAQESEQNLTVLGRQAEAVLNAVTLAELPLLEVELESKIQEPPAADLPVVPTPAVEPLMILTPPMRVESRTPLPPESGIVLAPPPELDPGSELPEVELVGVAEPDSDLLASYRIQLGSFREVDAAMVHWSTVLDRNQEALKGLRPLVRKADLGDRGTFFRLQAGPLKSSIDAISLCELLKVANADCLVISP